ncbi:MAG: GAF domain-containing protein, partial [Microcystaceae cyanobacterium]
MSLPLNPSETFLGNILKKIHNALDFTAILQVIVEQTQGFLQIDRVKIHQFAGDGSGCVIAEALHGQTLPSLLGLHFPSTDIPSGHRESLQRDRPIVSIDVTSRRKSF